MQKGKVHSSALRCVTTLISDTQVLRVSNLCDTKTMSSTRFHVAHVASEIAELLHGRPEDHDSALPTLHIRRLGTTASPVTGTKALATHTLQHDNQRRDKSRAKTPPSAPAHCFPQCSAVLVSLLETNVAKWKHHGKSAAFQARCCNINIGEELRCMRARCRQSCVTHQVVDEAVNLCQVVGVHPTYYSSKHDSIQIQCSSSQAHTRTIFEK